MTSDAKHWLISVDVRFRLFRVAYHWDSFLMQGILSMYHTCGERLPMTMVHVSMKYYLLSCNVYVKHTKSLKHVDRNVKISHLYNFKGC